MKVSTFLRPFEFLRRELYIKGNFADHLQRLENPALTPERKRVLYFAFLGLSLLTLFVIYWGGLTRGPYVDDNFLIFANQHVRNAENPLTYWFRGQPETKAWPITHTAYWLLYRVLGETFWAYRMLNVVLHWASGVFLFHFLARRVRLPSAAFAACFFWFHPIAVGAVAWIAQISTLATVLFLAWWLAEVQEDKEEGPRSGFFALLAMVLSKGFAYLLPAVQFRKRLIQMPLQRALLYTAPGVVIAGYGLFLAFVGTYYNPVDRPFLQTYYQQGNPVTYPAPPAAVAPPAVAPEALLKEKTKPKTKKKPAKAAGRSTSSIKAKPQSVATPMASPAPAVSPLVVMPEIPASSVPPSHVFTQSLPERIAIMGKTFVFYAARFISFSDIFPEMRATDLSVWNPLFLVIGLGIFALLGWALVRDQRILAAGLLVYLPVSGLFYIPFLKFRLVSDHMIYPAFFLFAWGVGLCVDRIRHKGLRRAYWLWPVLLAVFTVVEVRAERVEFPVETAIPLHEGTVK